MKKQLAVVVLSFIFVLAAAVGMADAENRKGAVSFSPHLGGYVFEGNQNINSDPVYGVGLGYNITERFGLEGVFDWVDTDSRTSSKEPDVEAMIYRLDALYHFMPESSFVPYVSLGGGAININKDPGESDTDALVNYGGGFKYFVTDSFAVRADVRHIIDVEDDVYNNLIYTLGLNMLFGGQEKAPEPMDSDGDGVYDDADKCPDTPTGVVVDNDGCPLDSDGDGVPDYLDKCPGTPAGAAVDKNGCPLDSDGDGVPDYLDKCPGTPAGAAVDSKGCPLDSDGDGVPDYMDKCPDTPKGIEVDSVGCPVPIKEKVSIELHVLFDFDSDRVKSVYREDIEKVAAFLQAYPEVTAEIEGHTDSVGAEEYNQKLSQRRATNVMNYLIGQGIDPNRIQAVGYGESRPVADNQTKEGRDRNRRVQAVISTIVTK